jgi:hypothetical protein
MDKENQGLSPELMGGTYPPNTIGFHYLMACMVFGHESPATRFLANKAAQCQQGLNEPVVASTEQVVMMLGALHAGSIKADDKGDLIPDYQPGQDNGND